MKLYHRAAAEAVLGLLCLTALAAESSSQSISGSAETPSALVLWAGPRTAVRTIHSVRPCPRIPVVEGYESEGPQVLGEGRGRFWTCDLLRVNLCLASPPARFVLLQASYVPLCP